MTAVKGDSPAPVHIDDFEPKHLGFLLDRLTRRLRRDLGEVAGETGMRGRHDPLTPSSFRLLAIIPDEGARITDLAALAAMTKQALGQFVDLLEPLGYVEVRQDPADRRVRVVTRTRRGDQVVEDVNTLFRHLHERWSAEVGPRRWAAFLSVLEDLAVGWEDET